MHFTHDLNSCRVLSPAAIILRRDGNEGLLVASKIADRSGITRPVIVNALRKLESAGVIESRSLGMKGTFIRILNDKFIEEISKDDMKLY